MPAWADPAWRAEADAWIAEQLVRLGTEETGAPEQLHVRPWATVIRVPAGNGDVYFKANAASLRFEAALVAAIAARRPDCVPQLLAVDVERGWMLMSDAGTRLRDLIEAERDLTRWLDVLPLYAGLQIDFAGKADELVALGVRDLRLPLLPRLFQELLDELGGLPGDERRRLEAEVPRVAGMCEQLAAYGIPETLQHDDLHDGQVYVRGGRYLILDWGDACVSHPFFTMAVTLDGVIAWGVDDVQYSEDTRPFRDAYLAPFAPIAGDVDLASACAIARRLGWAARAVNGHLSGGEPEQALPRLRMFLDGRP